MQINSVIKHSFEISSFNLRKKGSFKSEFQKEINKQTSDKGDTHLKEKISEYQNYSEYKKYNGVRNVKNNFYLDNKKGNEEYEDFNKKENLDSETKSDIIVKPDGSRVLIITMQLGGMESTISLQISKPTTFINSETEIDSNIKDIGN